MTETAFRRWRKELGFTQAQAAEALGLSFDHVRHLDTGATRDKPPRPMPADRRTLLAMAAIAADLEPWKPAD